MAPTPVREYTVSWVTCPIFEVNPIPVRVTIAPPVAVTDPSCIDTELPVTFTGAEPDTVSLPRVEVRAKPVTVTLESAVTNSVPRLDVITLPVGNTVLPIDTAVVPRVISNSGSLAATIVVWESPDIENVPIEVADWTPVTKIDVPGVFVETVNPAAVIVGLTEIFTVGEPVAVDPCTPVSA